MLSKMQISNFLKLRKSEDLLYNIKNIIILAMIKYYKNMDIITMIDNIVIKNSRKKEKISTVFKDNKYVISVSNSLNILNKIEYILNEINYIYNNNTCEKNPLKEIISLLQTEDIMKLLFKLIRLNNIEEFQELSIIDSKTYKCYIKQVETNLFRPLYNYYKKRDKKLIKSTEELISKIDDDVNNDYITNIDSLFIKALEDKDKILEISECYRKIKDIINNMLKILNN